MTPSFEEASKARYEEAYYCEECNWIGCQCPFPSETQPQPQQPKQPNKQDKDQCQNQKN